MPATKVNQSKAFRMLFFLEFWERFGYYGLQAVLASFFVKSLGMSDAESFVVFGAFSAMVYGYVSIGGYIGDKVLGTQRTILLGTVTLTIGYVLMAFAHSNKMAVFYSLAIIACGNGIFKANPASLLSKLYENDAQRLDSAFTMYYMSVNIGSFISTILVPIIGGSYGLSAGFAICAIGLIIAVFNFVCFRHLVKGLDSPAGNEPLSIPKLLITIAGIIIMVIASAWMLTHLLVAHWLLGIIGAVVFFIFFKLIFESKGVQRGKMIVALVLILEAIAFFTLYQQMPTSLNFFAIKNVDRNVLGLHIADPQIFQALNPFWIMIASPILAWLYNHFGDRGTDLSMPAKFTLGMLLCAISFFVVAISGRFADSHGLVSAWWLIISYLFQSLGELLISGLGLSMISKLVPPNVLGFLMGAWFLTSSIAAVLGGWVAQFTSVPSNIVDPLETLPVYTHVFMNIGICTSVLTVIMFVTIPWLKHRIDAKE